MSSTDFIKPAVGALVAIIGDRYISNNTNTTMNLYFGASVGAGLYLSTMITPNLPKIFPENIGTLANGKLLEDRITEIVISSGSAYVVNRFVLNNDYNPSDMIRKLGIIAASDFIGEYASDYFGGRALSYFQ